MIEYAEILGIIATSFSTIITFIDRKLVKKFKKCEAFSRSDAIVLKQQSIIKRWRLKKMIKSGLLVQISTDQYYYNINIALQNKKKRRKRAAILIPIFILVFITIYFNLQ